MLGLAVTGLVTPASGQPQPPPIPSECRILEDGRVASNAKWGDGNPLVVELPADQDEIEQEATLTWSGWTLSQDIARALEQCGLEVPVLVRENEQYWNTLTAEEWVWRYPIEFKTEGRGLFVATIIVERDTNLSSEPADAKPLTLLFDGAGPDVSPPDAWWTSQTHFTGSRHDVEVHRIVQQGEYTHWYHPEGARIRLSLRRVTSNCYMQAIVSGGRGAGVYTGEVAMFGNPTGVNSETVEGVGGMLEWAQEFSDWWEDEDGEDDSDGKESPSLDNLMSEAGLEGDGR